MELSEQGLQSLCTYSSHDSLLLHEAVGLDLLFFRINESSLEVSVETRSETTDTEANLDVLSLAETQVASVLLLHFCQNAQFSSAD